MPKVLIFAGAPEADWSSPDSLILSAPPAPSPINLSPAPISATSSPTSTPANQNVTAANTTTIALPSWRSLPLHHKPLATGYSQPHGLPSNFLPPAHFFSLSRDVHTQETTTDDTSTTTTDSQDHLLSQQFYNHSLALHHDLASSQLPPPPSASQPPPKHTDNTSFNTTTSSSFVTETTDSFEDTTTADLSTSTIPPPLQTSHHLSDLEDIPPAPSLLALAPQTVTVNLIAGVISISTPRAVTTRWGNELSLVEVLIGDETRAGFGVTFWLPSMPPPPPAAAEKSTGMTAAAGGPTSPANLRRQDVVLLQNVALHVFKGKVYGQSLRKGLTRTTVLYRRKLGEGDEGGYYRPRDLERSINAGDGGGGGGGDRDGEPTTVHPQLIKTRRVWEWVMRFVGGGGDEEQRTTVRGVMRRGWDALPDDTQ
ncbi:hypothetical protein BDP55DRAFT_546889 [Colletotrichum godetiae]|uniref:Nucleic acid-binding protein n=1 Tax=Colletotrichum godetiae TaxID=1209918 RepID=A0AAJ0ARX6_9PEZI|nr:uncharacterized protein BDP55DRAFT_546889 [Colletotrichum godetiae]KAK1689264.1 hypothetical protein BDP55DRAFT_546889 [Colletotrichum godetiae]